MSDYLSVLKAIEASSMASPETARNSIAYLVINSFEYFSIYFPEPAESSFVKQLSCAVEILGLRKISESIIFLKRKASGKK